jgi:hypothetical protein
MTEPSSSRHRLAALLSLTAAMVLTGANVVLGKLIVAEVAHLPVHAFSLPGVHRALLPLVYREGGPSSERYAAGNFATSRAWRCSA